MQRSRKSTCPTVLPWRLPICFRPEHVLPGHSSITARAAIDRSLRARHRKNTSKKNFWGVCRNVENAPTCCRAPKWPDPEFPRKIPKKYPPARNSGLPEFTLKCPENTEKIPPKHQKCAFLVFFWYFWGIFLGFRNFGPGVFFRYFSWKFRVGPSRGSSRSGRS